MVQWVFLIRSACLSACQSESSPPPPSLSSLCPSLDDLMWAVGTVQSRAVVHHTPMGTVATDTHMMLPYAGTGG